MSYAFVREGLMRRFWLSGFLVVMVWSGCGDVEFVRLTGSLRARIVDAEPAAQDVSMSLVTSTGFRETGGAVVRPETVLELHGLSPGRWDVEVEALDEKQELVKLVTVPEVLIEASQTTEIIVHLGGEKGPCDPDNPEEPPLCTRCDPDGELVAAYDDDRCGIIDCGDFEWFELVGDNGADGESHCNYGAAADITAHRCAGPGQCIEPGADVCLAEETTLVSAGECRSIEGCLAGAPEVAVFPDGTPCGNERICSSGACVPLVAEAGCADGTREGFIDQDSHPFIAGCSGGWSVGGITRPDLAPTCDHASGNDSANPEGNGCSAADLCSPGWHVCQGKLEVADLSPDGCAGAVPPGTPDKSLFFAVQQNSQADSVCDDSDLGNDVFGCGNLGTVLSPDKNCGPLDRVLASMHAGTCGFNEAEPPHGPWLCAGGDDSHLHEGSLVKKNGCPSVSCSYDGNPVDNSGKGGVLCCID
jgi:hypothetical protein